MKKIKVGVIFGGMSTEHDVSVVSGMSVIKNLNKDKYDVTQIYLSKDGQYYLHKDIIEKMQVGDTLKNLTKIENILDYLKSFDVLFPVLHGLYGEDGTIQGLFEMLKIPYVGCEVLASSVSMDKAYTKIIFDRAQIKQAKYVYIRKKENRYIYIDRNFDETIYTLNEVSNIIQEKIGYPCFIKPSNSGSSVGIKKANNIKELEECIEYASKFDTKILIEEQINGKEIECAVLGNEDVKASCVGQIIPADEFYSFEAKYKNSASKCLIPADITKEQEEKVRKLAIKAFKAVDGKGLSRVDFFINEKDNDVYINEINTMPGFTEISMYSKLWSESGIKYPELLSKLIDLALSKNVQ